MKFESSLLRESYQKITHKSGLHIYVFPKKLTTTYACLAAAFGSVDRTFRAGIIKIRFYSDMIQGSGQSVRENIQRIIAETVATKDQDSRHFAYPVTNFSAFSHMFLSRLISLP